MKAIVFDVDDTIYDQQVVFDQACRDVFGELKGKKLILNKSLLSEEDISDFEVESDLKVYYNIPPLNDKKDNSDILSPLLEKLGYIKKSEETEKKKSIFDFLKFK